MENTFTDARELFEEHAARIDIGIQIDNRIWLSEIAALDEAYEAMKRAIREHNLRLWGDI